jgi:serine/threonine protein kinase
MLADLPANINQQLKEDGKCVQVAVKSLKSQVKKFFEKELQTLEIMRNLDSPHLIKPIAAYKKGNDRCFVFPWAQGGNLREFLNGNQNRLDEKLVCWALNQMTGMAHAIKLLHGKKARHGDIKPANILRFQKGDDEDDLGTLVIADVGISKVHEQYTRYRTDPTTSTSWTVSYLPPEMVDYAQGVPIPRIYDIWALGCVFLEFTIWLILGQPEWKAFLKGIADNDRERIKFWKSTPQGPKIHENIEVWVKKVKSVVDEGSEIWRVVDLISKSLLVPISSNDRGSRKLKDIQICSIRLWKYIRENQASPQSIKTEQKIRKTSKKLTRCTLKNSTPSLIGQVRELDEHCARLLSAATRLQNSKKNSKKSLSPLLLKIQKLSTNILGSITDRANAHVVFTELEEISNCSQRPSYAFGPKLANQAKSRLVGVPSKFSAPLDEVKCTPMRRLYIANIWL